MDYLLNSSKNHAIGNDNEVLNLIINGLPSKRKQNHFFLLLLMLGFKPYYKWITF